VNADVRGGAADVRWFSVANEAADAALAAARHRQTPDEYAYSYPAIQMNMLIHPERG
jgi:hypothetical protein